ncbi:TetR family transcriptional regulator [Rhodococcus sp. SC4]|nr:TetR family transcriptional regulator [Rhodococcus sp. SC4]
MARPKEPLLSRRRSLEAALKIIDRDGLAALSIRRLADELGVNGASLYHHFENKDAIVTGAAQLALAEVRTPEEDSRTWREWLPYNARELRTALLKHPELIPVIVGKRSLGVGTKMVESSAARLILEGVPSAAVMPLIESLQLMAIGSALHETQGETGAGEPAPLHAETYPSITRALHDRGLTPDEIFEVISNSIVDAVEEAIAERQARWLPSTVSAD